MQIRTDLTPALLLPALMRIFDLAAVKVPMLDRSWDPSRGTPVFTVEGRYTTRGWTEWTQGFVYGSAILTFDATGNTDLLKLGRKRTLERMAPHVTHTGVHDHGFNILSTYGNLRRLMREGRIPHDEWEGNFYTLAIQASGAVQAARWSKTHGATDPAGRARTAGAPTLGFVYSFNGPHSLFVDAMRTIRVLGLAWQLGQTLMTEGDKSVNLLQRSVLHGLTTNQYILFHGDSAHTYDTRGSTCHEAVFNCNDGHFRCRSTQQGYSPFTTWTRGLAWAMCGFSEELEFLQAIPDTTFEQAVGLAKADVVKAFEQAAIDTCDHFLEKCSAADGISYWDNGAPGLARLGDWRSRPADPFNEYEPVDSTASAIAAQGLIRLGNYMSGVRGSLYRQAGLTIAARLCEEPYLATDLDHEGLLLHSIYHRPNGWDHVPTGQTVPSGESSMWGDYHLLELAVLIQRMAANKPYLTFFDA